MNDNDESESERRERYIEIGRQKGVFEERRRRDRYQWRKLFRTVVYATFIGSFLAFATVYLLVQWL
jgi:hypothetical protein